MFKRKLILLVSSLLLMLPSVGLAQIAFFNVVAVVDTHGTLDATTPSPAATTIGSTANFIFNAATGYHVASITGCGGTAYANIDSAVTSYSYTTGPITAACTVSAIFSNTNSVIQLPQTGQTKCYDTAGTEITCTGTRQDADIKAGAASPSPRFTDNNNGTVTDNLTGLVWLKDAGCFANVGGIAKGTDAASSYLTWPNALTWSNNLASGSCGLSDGSAVGDWRLPNINELESLVDAQNYYPPLPTGHPFINVQANYYWSSSSYAGSKAWYVLMDSGHVGSGNKTYNFYVWPVRAGQ